MVLFNTSLKFPPKMIPFGFAVNSSEQTEQFFSPIIQQLLLNLDTKCLNNQTKCKGIATSLAFTSCQPFKTP